MTETDLTKGPAPTPELITKAFERINTAAALIEEQMAEPAISHKEERMKCPHCQSENTVLALVDGTYYRGPLLMCRDCGHTVGGGKSMTELMEEEKARRKAARGKGKMR